MASPRLFDRLLIRVSATDGQEDVRGFLQGLVTNDTRRLEPDAADGPIWAALLTAQGKVLFDFLLWADGDDVLIDCEAAHADGLIRRLSIYRLRRKIAFERDEDRGVFWSADGGEGSPDPRLPELGRRWIAPIADDDADVSAGFRAHRLACGVTEGEAELGQEATLWLECNAIELNGVAFDKGCYVGQENTARMNWRQKVNRRLAVVPLDQADEKRQRIAYPELGYSVEHRRVEDMEALDLPDWQRAGIEAMDPKVADGAPLS
ncbi:YgfZ/GcvT domain-containing protein [Novosphingopyxis iocasae]|uniref:CAF17-like 4Fe-4S cluster assembly/insertion protein YgfZ n=1 Tax=Novosphingopyxis iocasae TaxID=2762729 RepID=UPI0016518514|nr:folate-binding protein [Novosphingopyxis iocasae]